MRRVCCRTDEARGVGVHVGAFIPDRAPALLPPVLPVLNNGIEREAALAEVRRGIDELLLRRIVFLALPEAVTGSFARLLTESALRASPIP